MKVNFGRFSDRGRSGQVSSYRLVNGYAERQGEGAKAPLPVFGVPGSLRWDAASYAGIIRGSHAVRGKGLYVVLGNDLVRFIGAGSSSDIGAIAGASTVGAAGGLGYVTMASNMKVEPQLGIVTEDGLYYYVDTGTGAIAQFDFSSSDFSGFRNIDFLDRYFIFGMEDGRWCHSGLDAAGNVNNLAFAYAESNADGLRGVFAHRGAAVAIGEESLEIFENAGTQPFAFSPIRADIEIGAINTSVITRMQDGLAWVDQEFDVRLMRGSEPESVGTDEIARAIRDLTDAERGRLKGDYYAFDRRRVYVLSSDHWTYELDLNMGVWHERKSRNRDNWLLQCGRKFDGKYIFGNRVDGKLWAIDPNVFTDAGEDMVMRAVSQPVHLFPGRGKCRKLNVDMVVGEGQLGADSYLMLETSIDGGATWREEGPQSIGLLGQRSIRVQWRNLGRFENQGMIFALSSSSPVLRCIIDVDALIEPLQ